MKVHKITVIPGGGIGPGVLEEGIKILKKIACLDGGFSFELTRFPWGCEHYLKHGRMMDENGIEILKNFGAMYLGAVGVPEVSGHISLWELLLNVRKSSDQYINPRPAVLFRGAPCPLEDVKCGDINMIFVREDSEGEYAGSRSWLYKGKTNEVAIRNNVFSRIGCERVIHYAYNLARKKGKTLTNINKGNVLNYSIVFWDQVFKEMGLEYSDIKTYPYLVDAVSMFMVKDPRRFEVVVTSNLFGDILTDLGAAAAGGLGLAAGANLNPGHEFPSVFEPIHGSASGIAGHNIADPLAAIQSVSQMLEFFEYNGWAQRILDAAETIMWEGKRLTSDMGGSSTTSQVGDEMAAILERQSEVILW